MKRPTRWAGAIAAIALLGGCSGQYDDVGSVDISAAKDKAAEAGASRGAPAAKGKPARPAAMPTGR